MSSAPIHHQAPATAMLRPDRRTALAGLGDKGKGKAPSWAVIDADPYGGYGAGAGHPFPSTPLSAALSFSASSASFDSVPATPTSAAASFRHQSGRGGMIYSSGGSMTSLSSPDEGSSSEMPPHPKQLRLPPPPPLPLQHQRQHQQQQQQEYQQHQQQPRLQWPSLTSPESPHPAATVVSRADALDTAAAAAPSPIPGTVEPPTGTVPLEKFRNRRARKKLVKTRPVTRLRRAKAVPGDGRISSPSTSSEDIPASAPAGPESRLQEQQAQALDQAQARAQVETRGPAPSAETEIALGSARAEIAQLTSEMQAYARRRIRRQKYTVTAGLIAANFILIFATWRWPKYYFLYLPLISLPLALNCIMIVSITAISLYRAVFRRRHRSSSDGDSTIKADPEAAATPPPDPEPFVMVMPCYNETLEECTRSLDSLIEQTGIDAHRRAIMVICDGRVRGPGMAKSTADYLAEDILVDTDKRETIRGAYQAWDGASMDVDAWRGRYRGVPFYCIVKHHNQGKRDSLIVIRSFLHRFNERHSGGPPPARAIFSARFMGAMTTWLAADAGLGRVEHLIGMDADTVFAPDCIAELLARARDDPARTVGVCGYVAVDFGTGRWNAWRLYQSAEYSIAQGLRRLHQSVATGKVSCLPGCCQLLRVCEVTCGDRVLVELFGYHPRPLDGMLRRIRATASEDRNHVCLMLTTFPAACTRQALRARAFTDVPRSWTVFLSQRRRWTLGATSNDLLLVTAAGTQWWERIVAATNVLTWTLNAFVIASVGSMVVAFMTQPWWIITAFVGVMLVPISYYLAMAVWLPRTAVERVQFLVGLVGFVLIGPIINISVMLYAVWYMDSFGWGKTRQVVAEEGEGAGDSAAAGGVQEEKEQHGGVGAVEGGAVDKSRMSEK